VNVQVCQRCKGSGQEPGTYKVHCLECKATGYPRGYIPPTHEECLKYAFPEEYARVAQSGQSGDL
jgi:DnaJ-class molecular chaperone